MTDHHNKCNNNEKVWNIVRITKMWHRDMKWANVVGKMVPIDFLEAGLSQIFTLWKTQYSLSAIKWSTVKWDMPVIIYGIKWVNIFKA